MVGVFFAALVLAVGRSKFVGMGQLLKLSTRVSGKFRLVVIFGHPHR